MGHDATFSAAITAAVPRARIKLDGEGWPYVPARYGRLEWRGLERNGQAVVYAYTDRARLITKLKDALHRRPTQHGDQEAVYAISTEDPASIQAAASLLQIRTRRAPDTGDRLRQTRFRPRHDRDEDRGKSGDQP